MYRGNSGKNFSNLGTHGTNSTSTASTLTMLANMNDNSIAHLEGIGAREREVIEDDACLYHPHAVEDEEKKPFLSAFIQSSVPDDIYVDLR